MELNRRKVVLLLTLAVGLFFLIFYNPKKNEKKYLTENGRIHGTFYKIIYESPDGKTLKQDWMPVFHSFEMSLSTFNDSSVISRINRNDSSVIVDDYFRNVFRTGQSISEKTEGAFDMTVAPLVNAWGFGFDKKENITSSTIDSILQVIGYEKVYLEGNEIHKENPAVMLDASAIAKGYSCDVLAAFLESRGVENYMVEIGGEVVVKGRNKEGNVWSIGITKPIDDSTMMKTELQDIVYMDKGGMATSGNYRQYYHKDGKKYSHTIDPRTGYPVDHSLLSATVVASNCMVADAYATAFMVLGLEESLALADSLSDLEAYFIYSDSLGNFVEKHTSGFESYLQKK